MWLWFHKLSSPPYAYRTAGVLRPWFWWPAILTLAVATYGGLVLAPPDYQQKDAFRILYVHVPSASLSLMVPVALKAAEQLEQQGVSCEVIDPRTIRPLDIDTIIESVKKTNRVVVAEESHPICGVGAEISAEIMERAFDYLDAPVKRVSGVDVPMPYAKNLEKLAIPDVERIVAAVREVAYLD